MNSKKREEERALAEKYYVKSLGIVAENLLKEKDDPYFVKPSEIESHGTKRKKTIRVIREHIYTHMYRKTEKYSYIDYYDLSIKYRDDAQQYAKEPEYPEIDVSIENFFNDILSLNSFKPHHIIKQNINRMLFIRTKDLKPEEKIYVQLNKNKYNFIKEQIPGRSPKIELYVSPKDMAENRIRSKLLSVLIFEGSQKLPDAIKEILDTDVHPEYIVSSPKFSDKKTEDISFRNYRNHPEALCKKSFNHHMEILSHYKDTAIKRINTLNKLLSSIKNMGYDIFMEKLIEYLSEKVLQKIGLMLSNEEQLNMKDVLCDHFDKMNYNFLFPKGYLYNEQQG